MHYLLDLANKLAATYTNEKGTGDDDLALLKRRKLIASLQRALELELTAENLNEQRSFLMFDYGAGHPLFSTSPPPIE